MIAILDSIFDNKKYDLYFAENDTTEADFSEGFDFFKDKTL